MDSYYSGRHNVEHKCPYKSKGKRSERRQGVAIEAEVVMISFANHRNGLEI